MTDVSAHQKIMGLLTGLSEKRAETFSEQSISAMSIALKWAEPEYDTACVWKRASSINSKASSAFYSDRRRKTALSWKDQQHISDLRWAWSTEWDLVWPVTPEPNPCLNDCPKILHEVDSLVVGISLIFAISSTNVLVKVDLMLKKIQCLTSAVPSLQTTVCYLRLVSVCHP